MAQFRVLGILLLVVLAINGALCSTQILCEDLPVEDCAFAVSSTGNRCVLEKLGARDGSTFYECQTSDIMAERKEEWIESEECVKECGLEKLWVGFSSDGLAQRSFVGKLCSPICQNNCPNIVDLFTKLAAGEGVNLGKVCNYVRPSAHRILADSVSFKNTDFVIESLAGGSTTVDLLPAGSPESSVSDSTLSPAPAPSAE